MSSVLRRFHRILPMMMALVILSHLASSCHKKTDSESDSTSSGPILVGVLLPLTGSSAIHGKDCLVGIEMAKDRINENGGINGRIVELKVEDTGSKTANVTDAMLKLISIHKVPVIIGPISSAETLAGAEVADREKVVLFSPTAASPKIHGITPYCYRIGLMTTPQGERMAEYCFQELSIESMGMLVMSDETGTAYANAFKSAFKSLGGEISLQLSYKKTDTEFRSAIIQFINANISALYVTCVPTTMGYISRQAIELNYRPMFFANAGVEGEDLLEIAGSAANGIVYTGLAPDDEFLLEFEKRAQRQPGISGPQGYDAFIIIVNALIAKGESREGIREYLANMPPYKGVGGTIRFDEFGEVVRIPHLKIVDGSSFRNLQ